MKYSHLYWSHLEDTFAAARGGIRVFLLALPQENTPTLAQLWIAPHGSPITELEPFMDSSWHWSSRERHCLQLLSKAEVSFSRKDAFLLSPSQIEKLFLLCDDIALEIKDTGLLIPSHAPAQIRGFVNNNTETSIAEMNFRACDTAGTPIQVSHVIGTYHVHLIDDQNRIFLPEPPLLRHELERLLASPPLPLTQFTPETNSIFETVAALGVNLDQLLSIAEPADEQSKLLLRPILMSRGAQLTSVRIHLVNEFTDNGISTEVEVTAKGDLSPVLPVTGPNGETRFLKRPTALEKQAKEWLFSVGAQPAPEHHGFMIQGPHLLTALSRLLAPEQLPPSLVIDERVAPQIIQLPTKPTLQLRSHASQVLAQLGFANFANIAVDFQALEAAMQANSNIMMLDNDTLLQFTPEVAKRTLALGELLSLANNHQERACSIGFAHLLIQSFRDDVIVEGDDGISALIAHWTNAQDSVDLSPPNMLLTTLRPYQQDALAWLSRMHALHVGRVLADDMGLGKTLMVLVLLAKLKENLGPKPSLVVAPTSVLDVWKAEAERHFKDLKVLIWHGVDRHEQREDIMQADVVITSYALLRRDISSHLGEVEFRYMILDEAQQIKNPRTESWKAARQIRAEQAIALSGTPIENRVEDLWSIVEMVAPGVLGDEKQFLHQYGQPIARGDQDAMQKLKKHIQPIVLRRRKHDVEKDLPPKIENTLYCDMTPRQWALYLQVLSRVQSGLQPMLASQGSSNKLRLPLLAALTRLRQICSDPRLLEEDDSEHFGLEDSGKALLLEETLKECFSMDRHIIIYSQFIKTQELIIALLKKLGISDPLWLHGASKNRKEIVERFQSPDGPPVIVVSLKAGGTGITLTRADTVIHYDPWWNPAIEDQATDRAHRIGQHQSVHVIKLICRNSIEERVAQLSAHKRQHAQGILDHAGTGSSTLSIDDLKSLLSTELMKLGST